MTKETIPQSIIDKINKEYPFMHFEEKGLVREFRCAAEYGYNLAEGRIKELEEWMEDLKLIFTPKQPASDKWISVKDGLPEELVDVLVCMKRLNSDNYYFIVADYYEGQWNAGDREDLDNNPDFYVVTHYQYLPKPPKDIQTL